MTTYTITDETELEEGDRIVTEINGREIAVFKHDGEYYAYLNWCAHQGGPCCEGNMTGTYKACYDEETGETSLDWEREDEILNCPWHGWEYDITSGECLSRSTVELPSYPVSVADGEIQITL